MSSPPRYQHQIQAQIKKRIAPQTLTPNDLDFYVRKVRRLETDNSQLTDQLNKLRVRLRRAQDYQIKHQVLLNEHSNLKKQIQVREQAVRDLKTLNEKLNISVNERTNKHQEWGLEKRGLLEEIEKWTIKAEENQVRRVTELANERARSEEAIKREIAFSKKDFQDREDQYRFQIRQLKKVLHEKEAVETIVTGRVQKIRKEKDEQIDRLGAVIQDQKLERAKSIEEKNEQISRLKEKFQKMINFELENIKKNLEDQGEVFSIELNGLKEIISIKNQQIGKLLEEIKRQAADHSGDRESLLTEISSFKDKIYTIEREGEQQLYNLKQKLMEIHAADLKELDKRYQEVTQTLRTEKSELEGFVREKDRIREEQRKDYDRNIHEFQDKIKEREQRITSLLDRIKDTGDVNTGELKDLHQSFHKIEVEKESLSTQYQNNITFMTQQIKKLTTSNEVKNAELKKLYEELHETKKKFEEDLKDMDTRMKSERKNFDEEKERDRKERQKLTQNLAAAERDFKNAERRLVRQKEKEEREKNKLKFIVEESERDIERLNKYIKSLDDNLKGQYKKSQMNILDGDSSRRQAMSRLQKQKIEVQTLKKIEVDQIQRKYELDSTRMLQENEKLKSDLVLKTVALEKAEAEVKKLDYQHRNVDKINKEKIFDYEKKMATLNSEINMTQQLYKTFIDAKARKSAQR